MNEKIQAILLKIIVELKKLRWAPAKDWEITFQGEGHVPLIKQIVVRGSLGDDEWRDEIETYIHLKLRSDDEITYFPEYSIYGSILIQGGNSKDIAFKMDADVAITDGDLNDNIKLIKAAARIDRLVEDHVEAEYNDYVADNGEQIKAYKQGGWKSDHNLER